jgi:hypothetical protein
VIHKRLSRGVTIIVLPSISFLFNIEENYSLKMEIFLGFVDRKVKDFFVLDFVDFQD